MEALSQDTDPEYDHVTLEFEDGQRQAEPTTAEENHSEFQGQNSCILCGASSLYNYHKPINSKNMTTRHWSTWRADCGRSLCKLLSFSGSKVQTLMVEGPYCLQCSCLVWDIHFTMTQLKTLDQRLRSLKANVVDKIRRMGGNGRIPRDGWTSEVSEMLGNRAADVYQDAESWNVGNQHQEGNELNEQCHIVRVKEERPDFDLAWYQDVEGVPGKEAQPQTPTRKRGRPKRSSDGASAFSPNLDLDSEYESGDYEEEAQIAKKKRGRPRKNLVRDDLNSSTITKRKRGRPKKSVFGGDSNSKSVETAVKDDDGVTVPRRKRGRPRKKPVDSTDDVDLLSVPKRQHKKKKTPRKCPVCSMECRTRIALSRHVDQEHPGHMFECPACPRKYKSVEFLDTHIQYVHGTLFPFYCSICRQGVNTQEELAQHEAAHNSLSNPFVCLICQKVFLNALDLGLHVPKHERNFQCTRQDCSKTFGSEEALTRHVDCHQRPVICEICGCGFRFPSQAAKHIKINHTDERHACKFCSRTYKDPAYLKEHLKLHTNPQEARRFPCKACGKAFASPYHRVRHEEIHTSEGTRAFVCSFCGKRFDTRVNLRSHEYKTHDPDPVSREKKRIGRAKYWQKYYIKRKREKEMQLARGGKPPALDLPVQAPSLI